MTTPYTQEQVEALKSVESIKTPKHSEKFVAMNRDAIILAALVRSQAEEIAALRKEIADWSQK